MIIRSIVTGRLKLCSEISNKQGRVIGISSVKGYNVLQHRRRIRSSLFIMDGRLITDVSDMEITYIRSRSTAQLSTLNMTIESLHQLETQHVSIPDSDFQMCSKFNKQWDQTFMQTQSGRRLLYYAPQYAL